MLIDKILKTHNFEWIGDFMQINMQDMIFKISVSYNNRCIQLNNTYLLVKLQIKL